MSRKDGWLSKGRVLSAPTEKIYLGLSRILNFEPNMRPWLTGEQIEQAEAAGLLLRLGLSGTVVARADGTRIHFRGLFQPDTKIG